MKILMVVALVVIVALFFYNERKRSGELEKVAEQAGFSFSQGQHAMPTWLAKADFYLFSQGSDQILNLMEGQRGGYQIAAMGYFYDAPEGAEGDRSTSVMDTDHQMENRGQTVIWLSKQGTPLVDFDLAPQDSPKRLVANHAGLKSFTFDGQDEFRRTFNLLGREMAGLRKVFSDEVILLLLSQYKDLYIEGRGDQWLCYRHDKRLEAEEVLSMVDECVVVLDKLQA